MEINDIKIFYEVAQLQSTIKAANRLGYVQSNISKRLSKLEIDLGTSLFHRTNKGMTLTDEGEKFLPYAQTILSTVSDIESAFKTKKKTIRLGATQSISRNYLHSFYFDETMTIFTNRISELTRQLKDCQIDFMMVNQEINDADIKKIDTIQETIFWTKANDNQTDFSNNKILVSRDTECPYRQKTVDYLEKNQLNNQVIEVDTLDMLLALLDEENTMALLPEKTIALTKNLKAIAKPDFSDVMIYIYALKNSSLSSKPIQSIF